MSNNLYASRKRAIAECDICGFQYKLKQLREIIVKGERTNIKACPECWNPSHPQLNLGRFPVRDPQAVRDPRPDTAGYAQSREIRTNIRSINAFGRVGLLTVNIT